MSNHVDGPAPDPDVLALCGKSGVWERLGPDLWLCPGGTSQLTWAEMPPEWGRYVECPSWRAVVEQADAEDEASPTIDRQPLSHDDQELMQRVASARQDREVRVEFEPS